MRIWLILLALWPSFLCAEPITILGGEHDDFTRIVFYHNPKSEWSTERLEEKYQVKFSGTVSSFNTEKAFSRITRQRVSSITIENNTANLKLDCNCEVSVFSLQPGILVLDVKNHIDKPDLEGLDASLKTAEVTQHEIPSSSTETIGIATANRTTDLFPVVFQVDDIEKPVAQAIEAKKNPVLKAIQDQLVAELARAGAQDLLLAPKQMDKAPTTAVISDDLEFQNHPIGFSAKTQVDLSVKQDAGAEMPDIPIKCPPKQVFDVSRWGNPNDTFSAIQIARRSMLEEFDEPIPGSAELLIQAFLFAGFGAEAIILMDESTRPIEHLAAWRELAEVFDGAPLEKDGYIFGHKSCDPLFALMTMLLEAPEIPDVAEKRSIIGEFSGLPKHIRNLLGPRLAQSFLAFEDRATALSIRNAMVRGQHNHNNELELLDGRIAANSGELDIATNFFEKSVDVEGGTVLSGLVELLTLAASAGRETDMAVLNHAEAVYFEHKSTKEGNRLGLLLAQNYAINQQYSKALEILKAREMRLDEDLSAVWNFVLEDILQNGSPSEFAKVLFQEDIFLRLLSAPNNLSKGYSHRAKSLGFPKKAEDLAKAHSDSAQDTENDNSVQAPVNVSPQPAIQPTPLMPRRLAEEPETTNGVVLSEEVEVGKRRILESLKVRNSIEDILRLEL